MSDMMNLAICMVIIVALGFVAFNIFGTANDQRRQRKAPRLGAEVHVASKRIEKTRRKTSYFVSFRLKDDNVMELPVTDDIYEKLHEGDFIKIVFKGELFEGFKRLDENAEVSEQVTEEIGD